MKPSTKPSVATRTLRLTRRQWNSILCLAAEHHLSPQEYLRRSLKEYTSWQHELLGNVGKPMPPAFQ